MKKTLLLVMSLFLCLLTACGTAETVVEETTAVAEESAPEVTEEVTTEEVEETTLGYTDEEMPEVIQEEFNQEIAMQKVERAIDCYRQLVATNDEATWNIIDSIENFGEYKYYLDLQTKDGSPVYSQENNSITETVIFAMGTAYYEYVNGVTDEVPTMSEYLTSNTLDEINGKYNYDKCVGKSDFDETMMYCGMLLINYLNQAADIEAANFEKLEEPLWTINDTYDITYKLSLLVDGEETGVFACFDENGMLIQIEGEDDADPQKVLIKTFPESQE